MEMAKFIWTQNVAYYREQLKAEANKEKQKTLSKLLAEAEAKLAQIEHKSKHKKEPDPAF